jgi:hypothetical protein
MAGESTHQFWAEGLAALDAALRALETKGRRAIAEHIRIEHQELPAYRQDFASAGVR